MLSFCHYDSPVGRLLLGATEEGVVMCDWEESRRHAGNLLRLGVRQPLLTEDPTELMCLTAKQLDEYFASQRHFFTLPISFVGTPFQCLVWQELLMVPFGTTITYGMLAQRLGRAAAVRAVANAVGSNPLSILVPCHRVVGTDGNLTGYAGGLDAKRQLLHLESAPQ
ncbi:MAG: methylated-DNA--[protein]-cysteine S-methyltransferase [Bacteroidaceae bacterium]|nr:methylated-DNA--[protein]-cysteine S-methyltransferase [Bacteroidaceae bacterium]